MARSGRDEQNERLYFRDETEEGNESVDENEEDASDNDEEITGPTGRPLSSKGKKTLKICRHFSYSIISNAVEMGWEEQEVANLIKLVANQLNFDEAQLIRCLEKTGTGSPATISCLLDESSYSFSVPQLVSVILSNARSTDHFITLMGEACECDLFDLSEPDTIAKLHMFVENNMDLQQSQRYARQLCEHTDNKRLCGQILHRFTSTMLPAEAASYMYDIVTLDFFQDIRGAMKELMEEIPRAREDLEGLLDESHQRDKDGEILDSDADSDGNLRDFVVDSDSGSEAHSRTGLGEGSDNSCDSDNSSDSRGHGSARSSSNGDSHSNSDSNSGSSGSDEGGPRGYRDQHTHKKRHQQSVSKQSLPAAKKDKGKIKTNQASKHKRRVVQSESEASDSDSSSSASNDSNSRRRSDKQNIKTTKRKLQAATTAQGSKKRPLSASDNHHNDSGSESDGSSNSNSNGSSSESEVHAKAKQGQQAKKRKVDHAATASAAYEGLVSTKPATSTATKGAVEGATKTVKTEKMKVAVKAEPVLTARPESSGPAGGDSSSVGSNCSSEAEQSPVAKKGKTKGKAASATNSSNNKGHASANPNSSSSKNTAGGKLQKNNGHSNAPSGAAKLSVMKQEDDIFEADGEEGGKFSRGVISDY